jgi:hypothetical protein
MFIILKIVCLICFWFSLGIYIYFKLDKGKSGVFYYLKIRILEVIQRLNFLELFLILLLIYCIFTFFLQFIFYNLSVILVNLNLDPNECFVLETQPIDSSIVSNTPSISNGLTKASDGAIMTAALAGGMKLAQKTPNIAGKLAIVSTGVAMGAGAIIAKNVAGNLSENLGKNITQSKFSSLGRNYNFRSFKFNG